MSQSVHMGPTVYSIQSNVHSWRMLAFHDENIFLLSNYSITEFDAAVPPLSEYSHVVRSFEPNHTVFVLIRYNKMQQYAGNYLLQVYSTCSGRPSRPSSGAQKTVTATSGTGHIT